MSILKNLFNKDNEGEKQEIFFTPDGRKWGVDIDKFTKKCLTSDNEKSKDTEITEGYEKTDEGDMVQVSKIIREVNSQGNMQNDTIRYDLIKTLLSVVLDKKLMSFGNLENELMYDFSFNIAFNTLLKEGIIYEMK
jgi:hypothetical protein